jgi:mono/diheme cytochrome c family protein
MKSAQVLMLTLAMIALAVVSYAQHSYTPDDIAAGGQLYRANCLGCHGPAGDAIPNAPLMIGKFRRGSSDEELARIIRTGISGTAMAAQTSLTESQIGTIVGFLRSVATSVPAAPAAASAGLPSGEAARGKTLFEGKGNCLSCHRVNGDGSQFGPDLSSIGNPPLGRGGRGGGAPAASAVPPPPAAVNLTQLQQSIVDPNATVSNTNRYVLLTLKDGSSLSGKLLNQDTFAIQVLDFRERLQSLSRSNIRDVVFKSPMPSYRDKFTPQELADVISYLVTLKGQTN